MIHVWALGFLGNDGCTCGYRCQRGKGLWRKFCCAISCLCVIKYPEEFCCVHRVALAKSPRRWNLPATSVTFSYKAKLCSSWVSPDLQQHERGAGWLRGLYFTRGTRKWQILNSTELGGGRRIYSSTVCFSSLHPTSWSELSSSNNKDHISTAHRIPVYWHCSDIACLRAACCI